MNPTVLDIETTGSDPWRHQLVAVGIGDRVYRPEKGRRLARQLMATPGATIVAHTNYDLRWMLLDGATLHPEARFHDTKVMAWMLGAESGSMSLEDLAIEYLGRRPPKVLGAQGGRVTFKGRGGVVPIEDAPWDEMEAYNLSDILTTGELYQVLRDRLKARGLWDHFETEEAPFSRLLVDMEAQGIPFDVGAARDLLTDTEARWNDLKASLVGATGAPNFNPASGDQVARYLYEEVWEHPTRFEIPRLNGMDSAAKMEKVKAMAPRGVVVDRVGRDYAHGRYILDGRGLKPPPLPKGVRRKIQEGLIKPPKRPTVSSKTLNVLYGDDPWVSDYVAFQKEHKLAGYLRSWIDKDHGGRLHGRFDQSGTATGRLAGREPNLQQVDNGPTIRGLFVGDLIVGDYAGLEARLAAHFSGDPVMLDIFRSGKDLYGVLAAQAWGGPPTKENEGRSLMKVLWLASQYGAQGETLANTMALSGLRGYTPSRADGMLRDLHFAVPRLFEWREEVIAEARSLGYVTTLGGRRRYLPGIDSDDWGRVAMAERQAVNSRVQGSAADIVRRAMLAARDVVEPEVAAICLQVHDEIIWERGPAWYPEAFHTLVEACEKGHGFSLIVPLAFECGLASSWADKGGGGLPHEAHEVMAA